MEKRWNIANKYSVFSNFGNSHLSMSKNLAIQPGFRKFPLIGILLGLLYVIFSTFLFFQLSNFVPENRSFSIHPTKISTAETHKTSGKITGFIFEEVEEKEEENYHKNSLGTYAATFETQFPSIAAISRGIIKSKFIFYCKVSLYILFQKLRLDLA